MLCAVRAWGCEEPGGKEIGAVNEGKEIGVVNEGKEIGAVNEGKEVLLEVMESLSLADLTFQVI